MTTVFLACPTHADAISIGAAQALWRFPTDRPDMRVISATNTSSLLTKNCNRMWVDCLNRISTDRIDWFAMLHSDIAPEPFWLDRLIAEANVYDADMVSAVVPIKDSRGITSTAIELDHNTPFCALTQHQVQHSTFPTTFDVDMAADALWGLPEHLRIENVPRSRLLCNTGCMIVRLGIPRITEVFFETDDWIEKDEGGKWIARGMSEDWRFSQRMAFAGGKVMATKAVKVRHIGMSAYPNYDVWGTEPRNAPRPQPILQSVAYAS